MPRRIALRSAGNVDSNRTGKPSAASAPTLRSPKRRAALAPCDDEGRKQRAASVSPHRSSNVRRIARGRKGAPRATAALAAAHNKPMLKIAPRCVLMLPVAFSMRASAATPSRSSAAKSAPAAPRRARLKNVWRNANRLRMNVRASMSRWLPLSTKDTSPGFGSSASSSYSAATAARPMCCRDGSIGAIAVATAVALSRCAFMPPPMNADLRAPQRVDA